MPTTVTISPLTRIEGHLAIHTEADEVKQKDGKKKYRVRDAQCQGEMFRGFEEILKGRDPLDAQQITQRICGVCPVSHGIASCRAQEAAYGIRPTHNGRLIQNLILAANYLQSHIIHFYHLSAIDFVDVTAILKYSGSDHKLKRIKTWVKTAVDNHGKGKQLFPAAPFLPRYEGDYIGDTDINCGLLAHYVDALELRRVAHEMTAVFSGKMPHSTSIVPGGCTQGVTMERILAYRSRLKKVSAFVDNVYGPDVLIAAKAYPQYWDVGSGCKDLLCFGVFEDSSMGRKLIPPGVLMGGKWQALQADRITEDVGFSRFTSPSGRHPSRGETAPSPHKSRAYSWLKAPRYKGQPVEVGPLARMVTAFLSPEDNPAKALVGSTLKALGLAPEKLHSVLGRHASRWVESKIIVDAAHRWLDELRPGDPPAQKFKLPEQGEGAGLTEAPRGALGHWLTLKGRKIDRYQCIVPTTWNCSPRDDSGKPGPVEQALQGVEVADPKHPLEVARVVRSFDPCLACAIH